MSSETSHAELLPQQTPADLPEGESGGEEDARFARLVAGATWLIVADSAEYQRALEVREQAYAQGVRAGVLRMPELADRDPLSLREACEQALGGKGMEYKHVLILAPAAQSLRALAESVVPFATLVPVDTRVAPDPSAAALERLLTTPRCCS